MTTHAHRLVQDTEIGQAPVHCVTRVVEMPLKGKGCRPGATKAVSMGFQLFRCTVKGCDHSVWCPVDLKGFEVGDPMANTERAVCFCGGELSITESRTFRMTKY